jgi:hypothetical protein
MEYNFSFLLFFIHIFYFFYWKYEHDLFLFFWRNLALLQAKTNG